MKKEAPKLFQQYIRILLESVLYFVIKEENAIELRQQDSPPGEV